MAPNKVRKSDVSKLLHIYPAAKKKPKFTPGDYVRLSHSNSVFRKGYKSQFTNEIFKIVRIDTRNPIRYNIQDKDGEVIKGKVYEPELVLYTI